ncbi:B3 domain-containing transcription factor VRN1-like [Impatiens glandulifera]|uniref:B3 domain-containing transcription factor VRN1-like n=1 Tax=Impatiens glandulifera TaxID=253017 RepID=UPI001FB0776A|nr:B3 domain-containing transcription factor VRN1-like [Impatiens glandulifera]
MTHHHRPLEGGNSIDCRRPSPSPNKSPTFYRLMESSVIHDKRMRIPGKFGKKFGIELTPFGTLIVPNGCVWKVSLEKLEEDKLWFTNGWHEFVQHQSIGAGNLLVFAYMGNTSFRVNIYNLATAEVKYQCHTLHNSVDRSKDRYKVGFEDDDEGIDMLKSYSTSESSLQDKFYGGNLIYRTPLMMGHVVKSQFEHSYDRAESSNGYGSLIDHHHKQETDLAIVKEVDVRQPVGRTREVGIQCVYVEPVLSLKQNLERNRKRMRKDGPCEPRTTPSANNHDSKIQTIAGTETSFRSVVRKSRDVTPEEKERVTNISKAFHSEYPFCRVVLRRSYVYKGIGLHMPSSFADKYLNGVTGFLVLQSRNGKKWSVRCLWRDGSAKLSKGWPEFVWDNKLEEGDVCIFELIDVKDMVLRVTIFHVHDDEGQFSRFPGNFVFQSAQTSQISISYDLNG